MKYTRMIVNVIEPEQKYLLDFTDMTAQGCESQLLRYLEGCPQGTKYMHIQNMHTINRQTKYAPMQNPTAESVVNIGERNENR